MSDRKLETGNITSPTEDITRDNRILITRVGTIRTRGRAISMGVTSISALSLRFTASNETERRDARGVEKLWETCGQIVLPPRLAPPFPQ
jgi:hypothetical protein